MTDQCEHAEVNETKYTDQMRCSYSGDCRYQISYIGENYCKVHTNPKPEPEPRVGDFGLAGFLKKR